MSLRTNGHIVLVSGLHLNTKDKIKKLASNSQLLKSCLFMQSDFKLLKPQNDNYQFTIHVCIATPHYHIVIIKQSPTHPPTHPHPQLRLFIVNKCIGNLFIKGNFSMKFSNIKWLEIFQ